MTANPPGRYSATEQFLAHIDEADPGPEPTDEEAFEPFDLDERLDGADSDPDHPQVLQPAPSGGPPGCDDTAQPDYDDVSEPATVGAPRAAWGSSTGDDFDPNFADDEPYDPDADYHGDGYDPDPDYGGDFGPIDTDEHPAAGPDAFGGADEPQDNDDQSPTAPTRFSKPIVIGFLSAVAVVTIGVAAAMIGMQSSSTDAPTSAGASAAVSVVPPPAAPPAAAPINDPSQDVPIPFQASSPCPQAGSGSAQNVASEDPKRAWVCMRDADGQVMTLDLGKPMKVTAIELTPGWVGTDASGADQWMAHRVVTRVQWILINGADRTVVTQDTKNAHGSVPIAMPSNGPDQGVLASQIQMVILQTSRPPADNPTPTTAGPGADPSNSGGLLDDVLGAPVAGGQPSTTPNQDPNFGATDTGSDPVDNTVAISSIKILGHPPL